ncbi:hypothetical protein NECAME_08729 [Necator americanus]|nr:hypothetical protein NECAME_08729 [Necator americanus]ETN81108.1 hypothetical protein NECAME_08729 [Necator americanus]
MLGPDQPVPFVQSDTDLVLRGAAGNELRTQNPLIYSDPELQLGPTTSQNHETSVPEMAQDAQGLSDQSVHEDSPHGGQSTLTVPTNNIRLKSDLEIRHQHYQKQKQYAEQKRQRRLTDIDFEGILNIIGGCSNWQVLVYMMISVQQIPHAMFNLSVVYMMYQPDHWCKIPFFNAEVFSEANTTSYTWEDVLNSQIAFPTV